MKFPFNILQGKPDEPPTPDKELIVSARSWDLLFVFTLLSVSGGFLWLNNESIQNLKKGWLYLLIISFLFLLLVILGTFIKHYSLWKFDDKGIVWKRLGRKEIQILWCNITKISIYFVKIQFADQNSIITFEVQLLSSGHYRRAIRWICLFIIEQQNFNPRLELILPNQEPIELDKNEAIFELDRLAEIKEIVQKSIIKGL